MEEKEYWITPNAIGQFEACPQCFWASRVHGVWPPRTPEHVINIGIDESDKSMLADPRKASTFLKAGGITEDVVWRRNPELLTQWQEEGIKHPHEATGLFVGGKIDALLNPKEPAWKFKFVVMDGKSTAQDSPNIVYANQYRDRQVRQIAFYRWVLKQMGYSVADYGYLYFHITPKGGVLTSEWEGLPGLQFTTAQIQKNPDPEADPEKVSVMKYPFIVEAHRYELTGVMESWIEPTLAAIKTCLESEIPPPAHPECETCEYLQKREALRAEFSEET